MSRSIEVEIRTTLIVTLICLTLAAWSLTYYEVRNMGLLMQARVPMALGMEGWVDLTSFVVFTGMWFIMMVAMMLPSTYPVLLLHRTSCRRQPHLQAAPP